MARHGFAAHLSSKVIGRVGVGSAFGRPLAPWLSDLAVWLDTFFFAKYATVSKLLPIEFTY